MSQWKFVVVALASIVLAGVAVYSNIYDVPFVFDDVQAITENLELGQTEYSLEELMHTRSIGYLTFDVNFWIHGKKDPAGYHAGNVIIHLLVAILSFWLTWSLVGLTRYRDRTLTVGGFTLSFSLLAAWLVGLLFVVHPLHTQAVTYIVQRIASLATLFYLLALLAYVRYRVAETTWVKIVWAAGSLIAVVVAMHTKEIAITLPVAIVLLELVFWWDEWRENWGRRLLLVLPWLLTLVIIPAYLLEVRELLLPQPPIEGQEDPTLADKVNLKRITDVSAETRDIDRVTYLRTEINVIRTYLRLVVWPVNLTLDYDYPWVESWRDGGMWASLALEIALVVIAGWLWYRKRPLAAFGILFFFLALMPESSLFPIIDPIFEHRTYLPFIGFALVMAEGWLWLLDRYEGRRWRWGGNVPMVQILLLVVLIVFVVAGVATWQRNTVWQSQVSIWRDIMLKAPNKSRPHNNLGLYYIAEGNAELAIDEFERAIELDAEYAEAHNNLGMVYIQQGKLEQAETELGEALRINPDYAHALNNLGAVHLQYGRTEEAEKAFARAVELDENYAGARDNLGMTLVNLGRLEEAEKQFLRVLEVHPEFLTSRNNLGVVYFNMGRLQDAYRQFEMVLEIDPNHVNAKNNLRLLDQQRRSIPGLNIER